MGSSSFNLDTTNKRYIWHWILFYAEGMCKCVTMFTLKLIITFQTAAANIPSDMNSLVWLWFLLYSFLFHLFAWIHHLPFEGVGAFLPLLPLSCELLLGLEMSSTGSLLPSWTLVRALDGAHFRPPFAVSFVFLLLLLHWSLHSDGSALQLWTVQF